MKMLFLLLSGRYCNGEIALAKACRESNIQQRQSCAFSTSAAAQPSYLDNTLDQLVNSLSHPIVAQQHDSLGRDLDMRHLLL